MLTPPQLWDPKTPMAHSSSIAADEATTLWYNEYKKYNFSWPGFSSGTGHFTQVVWKGSSRLGMGVARASSGYYYVVGNYDPPGNYADQFRRNVEDK